MRRWSRAGWANAAWPGCGALEIDYAGGALKAGGKVIQRGEYLTLDGSTGEVMAGRVPTVKAEMSTIFASS